MGQAAQRTESSQLCRSLLLSKKACTKMVPSLQILADDVACSHGATVTELDESEVFYALSRGLDRAAARNLLMFAFPQDVLENIDEFLPGTKQHVAGTLSDLAEG